MKTLYFDCSSGISGNMTLGALLEIVGDTSYFLEELKKLQLDGYQIKISKKVKNGITGTYVDVLLEEEHHHSPIHHNHEHRNLKEIFTIIDNSQIEKTSKALAKKIFYRVAEAESKVHGKPIEQIHFHEVGAIDSIIDIVGTAILIQKIHPEKIIASVVNDGYGFIQCAHGKMTVPVPATSEIMASSKAKFRQIDIPTELVTPTGAAIIAELATQFTMLPTMKIEKIGWGAGLKDLQIPNVLKVYYGEIEETLEEGQEEVAIIETNIDDCQGEILGYTLEQLLQQGALDVFYTPIYMKKNRPAYCLTVICKKQDMPILLDILFRETTTIGIRYHLEKRMILDRKSIQIDTKYGKLQAKQVQYKEDTYVYPEYESMKEIALKNAMPLKEVYGLAKEEIQEK